MTVQVLEIDADGPDVAGFPGTGWLADAAPDAVDDGLAVPGAVPTRRGEPPGEPERILDQSDPLQAVFDAEFAAIVLASRPWGESRAERRTTPPRVPTGTRRDPAPGPLTPQRARHGSRRQGGAVVGTRRRPVPGPRSPPR